MSKFDPNFCRNESEVESKLIVQYLLPEIGYSHDDWHQQIAFGSIRLDFLVFASRHIPYRLGKTSPGLIIETKHPNKNLDHWVTQLKNYMLKLNVEYGLLTNAKELRIYKRNKLMKDIEIVFQCPGNEITAKIDEISSIIGKENLIKKQTEIKIEFGKIIEVMGRDTLKGKEIAKEIHKIKDLIDISIFRNKDISDFFNKIKYLLEKNKERNKSVAGHLNTIRQLIDWDCFKGNEKINKPKTPNNKKRNKMKVIAVYHNKGGVGKTTTVVNLAAALSKKGKRVLVVDLDSQANTTFATGLVKFTDEEFDDIKGKNISQVMMSSKFDPIEEIVRKSRFTNPEIDVVPSHIELMELESNLNQRGDGEFVFIDKLQAVKDKYDIVIIDTPPSLNLYAKIALRATDYLIIPSDLKPFANQGLWNVKDFIESQNNFKKHAKLEVIKVLGVLPCKISTNNKFVTYTLPTRLEKIKKVYGLDVMKTCIFEREAVAKSTEEIDENDVPNPISVLDFDEKSEAANQFYKLADEVIQKIGG